jgi:hypothetical protein
MKNVSNSKAALFSRFFSILYFYGQLQVFADDGIGFSLEPKTKPIFSAQKQHGTSCNTGVMQISSIATVCQ